jgi:CRP-like cAMP-binding protein
MTDSEILGSIGPFNEPEVELFKAYRHVRLVKQKEQLLRTGDVCRSVYFLKRGAMVQYKPAGDQERLYTSLHVEKDWMVNYKSLMNQSPAEGCIEAFTECEVAEISLEAIHNLIRQSSNFLQLNRLLGSVAEQLDFFDRYHTPAEKYEALVRHNPRIIQTFPLKTIASYLKISPETLSRVRSKS